MILPIASVGEKWKNKSTCQKIAKETWERVAIFATGFFCETKWLCMPLFLYSVNLSLVGSQPWHLMFTAVALTVLSLWEPFQNEC